METRCARVRRTMDLDKVDWSSLSRWKTTNTPANTSKNVLGGGPDPFPRPPQPDVNPEGVSESKKIRTTSSNRRNGGGGRKEKT